MSLEKLNPDIKMKNIFSTLVKEKDLYIDGSFAADMLKVNKESDIYPCFVGFNKDFIIIIKLNIDLEKVEEKIIEVSDINSIIIKKKFLSKMYNVKIFVKDDLLLTLGTPYKLKEIKTQESSFIRFIDTFGQHTKKKD